MSLRSAFISTLAVILISSACKAENYNVAEAFATYSSERLNQFISQNSEINFTTYTYGREQNIVHAALVNKNNDHAINQAVSAGADINHKDDDGRTPLHHAIDANLKEKAKQLLKIGANLNIENEAGFTPLEFCKEGLKSLPDHKTCLLVTSFPTLPDK